MTRVMGTNEIDPDGIIVTLPLTLLEPGMSVFVPCVNVTEAMKQITRATRANDIPIRQKIVVEDHILGVRIWRTA